MEKNRISPARQKFRSYEPESYIRRGNTPSSKGETSGSKRLILIILIVLTTAATIVWCYFAFNKYREEEEKLYFGNGYYDVDGNWKGLDKPDLPDINLLEIKGKAALPKIEASAEILSSSILSGQFQIGGYIYTLPMPLSEFLGCGIILYDTPEWEKESGIDLYDVVFSGKTRHEAILKYDDYTFFHAFTYDESDKNITEATVISVAQYTDDGYWNNNAQYVYYPGGLHVEMEGDVAAKLYDVGDGSLKVLETKGRHSYSQYNYNGKEVFPWNEMNFIQFVVDTSGNNSVRTASSYKNR